MQLWIFSGVSWRTIAHQELATGIGTGGAQTYDVHSIHPYKNTTGIQHRAHTICTVAWRREVPESAIV